MTKPSATVEREIFEAEAHAATLSRMLGLLRIAQGNARQARDRRLVQALNEEIAYTIRQLAEVQARRERIRDLLK